MTTKKVMPHCMYCGIEGYAQPTDDDPLAQRVYCGNLKCGNYNEHIYTGTLVVENDEIKDIMEDRCEDCDEDCNDIAVPKEVVPKEDKPDKIVFRRYSLFDDKKEDLSIQEESLTHDPWKHGSQGMRCKKCMWFVAKEKKNPEQGEGNHLGRCRKNAPTINGWPVVFVNDWCGDHKIDEEKL